MNLPKAILFDLDDTLVVHNQASDEACEIACRRFSEKHKPAFTADMLNQSMIEMREWFWSTPERHLVGRANMKKARREIATLALNQLGYFNENHIFEMADEYTQVHAEQIRLLPNSIPTLDKLKSMGVRMALITNGESEIQRQKIDRFALAPYFEFILVEGEIGFGKPDKRVFELALEKLNLPAQDVWMIGDKLSWDVQAPQAVGIFSIWNDYDGKGLPPDTDVKPDRIVRSIAELLV